MEIEIDFYADVACPWCYIGLRRIHRAGEARKGLELNFRWRPYQLQPQLPPEGVPWSEFVPQKFGSVEQAAAMFRHVAAHGAEDAIDFGFDDIVKANNTRDAHRLLLWAQEEGQSYRLAEELFADYFTRARDLNDPSTLVSAAKRIGLPEQKASSIVEGNAYGDEVDASQAQAQSLGVTGVPFVIVQGQYGIAGAQPLAVILRTLDLAVGEARKTK